MHNGYKVLLALVIMAHFQKTLVGFFLLAARFLHLEFFLYHLLTVYT